MVIDIYTERMAHDNTTVIMADSEDVLFEVIWIWRVEDIRQVHDIHLSCSSQSTQGTYVVSKILCMEQDEVKVLYLIVSTGT